ncbi:MAG: putative holin-like toxin [Natronincolaceae bacterium]|nr:putative holin-like toxin [Bacillota bacterium]
MNTYQTISLMIMFGMLLISLISLIVGLARDNNKRKK